MKTLEENLYRILEKKMMSQSKFAAAIGMNPRMFNSMLRGRKTLKEKHVREICRALDITPNELYGFDAQDENTACR